MILEDTNYTEQQVTRCQFYLNEGVTRQRAPRLSSLIIQADRPICNESRLVFRNPENTTRVILTETGSYSP